jgi:transcriptional regulator GlxA family with amidase domain
VPFSPSFPADAAGGPRAVAFLIFDGAQSLDITGPLEVFAQAGECARKRGLPVPYAIEVLAEKPGPVRMTSGLRLVADRAYEEVREGIDTLILGGGDVAPAASDPRLRAWLLDVQPTVRRLASVCSGAFILAEAGLLDGRRVTTHWLATRLFRRLYPQIELDADAIFVRDGSIYTSAGVTAGIDMALALVQEDLGRPLALDVARRLVVFLKRPGGQSQFSAHLAAQAVEVEALRGLPAWILEHLGEDLSNGRLAERVGMSPRNFARVFRRESGCTPGKFVERARVDAARRLLEDGDSGLEDVSRRCGFGSGEQMRRTFVRHVGVVPIDYRRRFRVQTEHPVNQGEPR